MQFYSSKRDEYSLCRGIFILCLLLCNLLFLASCTTVKSTVPPWLKQPGSTRRGASLYKELACFTCHRNADSTMPKPLSSRRKRTQLGSFQDKSDDEIIMSILANSHLQSSELTSKAPLGSYNSVLTVQQVQDLVAYLKKF